MHKFTFSDSMKLCESFIGINTINGQVSSWDEALSAAREAGCEDLHGFIVVDPANCWMYSQYTGESIYSATSELSNFYVAREIEAACETVFHVSESAMLLALKRAGVLDYLVYSFFAKARNARFSVVTIDGAYCLVRMDTLTFVKCHGNNSWLLEKALERLGYKKAACHKMTGTPQELLLPSFVKVYTKDSEKVTSNRRLFGLNKYKFYKAKPHLPS